jgi:hypothetical protein
MSGTGDLCEPVLAVVRERQPISGNKVAEAVPRRKADVLATLTALEATGQVERTRGGYKAVPTAREPVPYPVPAVDVREPTCRDPEHRRHDWAMPNAEQWICGACHPPSDLCALTGSRGASTSAEARPPEPVSHAGAFDAWQRRADR